MKIAIRTVGNSRGVIIPKHILAQLELAEHAEMTVEDGAIVLRKPAAQPRTQWAEAARRIADANDDALVFPEFPNSDDQDLKW